MRAFDCLIEKYGCFCRVLWVWCLGLFCGLVLFWRLRSLVARACRLKKKHVVWFCFSADLHLSLCSFVQPLILFRSLRFITVADVGYTCPDRCPMREKRLSKFCCWLGGVVFLVCFWPIIEFWFVWRWLFLALSDFSPLSLLARFASLTTATQLWWQYLEEKKTYLMFIVSSIENPRDKKCGNKQNSLVRTYGCKKTKLWLPSNRVWLRWCFHQFIWQTFVFLHCSCFFG